MKTGLPSWTNAPVRSTPRSMRCATPFKCRPRRAGACGCNLCSISHSGELRISRKGCSIQRMRNGSRVEQKVTSQSGITHRTPRPFGCAGATTDRPQDTGLARQLWPNGQTVALVALAHRLALKTFFNAGYSVENVVQIDTEAVCPRPVRAGRSKPWCSKRRF